MQDRFNFRVWKELENRMIDNITNLNPLLLDENLSEEAKHNILMQCTGVKDKKEKLIFEGDIVKIRDVSALGYPRERTGVVKYMFGDYYPAYYVMTTLGDAKDFTSDMEVIGNIYENKDLLK